MGFFSAAMGKGGPFGTIGITIAILLLIFKTFFVVVHQGQLAVPMFRGRPSRRGDILAPISDASRWVLRHLKVPGMEKVERVLGPQKIRHSGIAFRIPGLGMLKLISTMDKRNALDEAGFTVTIADPVTGDIHMIIYEILGDVIWHIRDDTDEVINSMFNADELSEIVVSTVSSSIGTVYQRGLIESVDYRNNKLVCELVIADCSDELLEYGVSIKRLKLRKVQEVPVQIRPLAEAIRASGSQELGAEVSAAVATAFTPVPAR